MMSNRVFDLCCVVAAAPLAATVAGVAAVAVAATSPGGALFRHRRIGRGGRPFDVLKMRTMVDGAQQKGPAITAAGDARITGVGRVLRRTKLDELPQLWNVVRGEMSLVGPRPEAPQYVDPDDPSWREVLSVRPGLTDLSSLVFRHEETLLEAAHDRERAYSEVVLPLKLDLAKEGVRRSSLLYDGSIIVKTLLAVVRLSSSEGHAALSEARLSIAELNNCTGAVSTEHQEAA